MSQQLFTELTLAQQEIISGGTNAGIFDLNNANGIVGLQGFPASALGANTSNLITTASTVNNVLQGLSGLNTFTVPQLPIVSTPPILTGIF